MGIGVIDVDNHECMTLGSVQSPDTKTLNNIDKTLVDWYAGYLINRKEQIQRVSNIVVADAFFFPKAHSSHLCVITATMLSVVSGMMRFFFIRQRQNILERKARPKLYDGTIDFSSLDISRCTEHKVDKGKLYGLKAWSKAMRRMISLAVWYPEENSTDKWQLYFSTDQNQSAIDVLEYYRTRFQLEFCFRDSKQYAGITDCQSTDFRKLSFHFNASLTAINLAKAACKRIGIPYSISSCKSVIHNAYMLERFICVFGIQPDTTLIDKIFQRTDSIYCQSRLGSANF